MTVTFRSSNFSDAATAEQSVLLLKGAVVLAGAAGAVPVGPTEADVLLAGKGTTVAVLATTVVLIGADVGPSTLEEVVTGAVGARTLMVLFTKMLVMEPDTEELDTGAVGANTVLVLFKATGLTGLETGALDADTLLTEMSDEDTEEIDAGAVGA